MRTVNVTVYHLTYDAADSETEWTLTCRVYPPTADTRWEPGDSGDVEIVTATAGARTMTGDDWVDEFDIPESTIYAIGDKAIQEMYEHEADRLACAADDAYDRRRDREAGL